mmetsp:Transcript_17835/g.54581  ORF Transcript_17835/g.54581 Transcript_17835/m.54581 type:complete len:185 (-) Transcript_17835:147-701(-)
MVTDADLAGKSYYVDFACFGYADRFCTLALGENGFAEFGNGLKAGEQPGPWRVETEEGIDYLQVIMPTKEIYRELYNIKGDDLFWRAELQKDAEGNITGVDGKIISEKKSLLGLKTDFVLEGTFKMTPLTDQKEREPMKGLLDKIEQLRLATGQDVKAQKAKGKKGAAKKGAAKKSASSKGMGV